MASKKRKPIAPIKGARAERIAEKNRRLRDAIFIAMDASPILRNELARVIRDNRKLGFAEKYGAASDAAIKLRRLNTWMTKKDVSLDALTSMLYFMMFGDEV